MYFCKFQKAIPIAIGTKFQPNSKFLITNSFLRHLIHSLYHLKGRRAFIKILPMNMKVIDKFFLGQMRKACAISRSHFIYFALVCSKVKKLARRCLIKPFTRASFLFKPL